LEINIIPLSVTTIGKYAKIPQRI